MEIYQRLILGGFVLLTVIFILLIGRNLVKYVWREPLWFARRINLKLFIIFLISVLVPAVVLSAFMLVTVETLFDSLVSRADIKELKQITTYLERQINMLIRNSLRGPINIGRLRNDPNLCVTTSNATYGSCFNIPRYLLIAGKGRQTRQIQVGQSMLFKKRVGKITTLYRVPEDLSQQYLSAKNRMDSVGELLADRKSIVYQLRVNVAFLLAVTVFCALWVGVFLGRNFTQFLTDLIKGLDEISKGNLEFRMSAVRTAEFYFIKKKFDSTAVKLKQVLQALDDKSRELTAILDNCGVAISIFQGAQLTYQNILYRTLIGDDDKKIAALAGEAVCVVQKRGVATPFTVSKILHAEDKILSVFLTVLDTKNRKVVASIRDVTRIIQEERNVLLKDILSKIAHEIRNPLMPVENKLKKLKNSSPATIEGKVDEVLEEVARFKKLISELLSNIRVNEIRLTTFNITDLIFELAESLKPSSKAVNLIAFNNLASETVTSDRTILTLALKNLLENAFEYANEGTNVIVTTSEDDQNLYISVESVSTPIPLENWSRIFEPYFTTNPRGTGLGLYISRIALNSIGGRLVLEKSDQSGTVFKIIIPKQLAKLASLDVA